MIQTITQRLLLGFSIIILAIIFIDTRTAKSSEVMGKSTTGNTTVSELTGDNRSIVSHSSSSSDGRQRQRKKYHNNRTRPIPPNVAVDGFNGATDLLKGKTFVMGGTQAAKYDEAYKALLTYFGSKYDQRIYRAFQQKDADAGKSTIIKPTPPMIMKVVQEPTEGADSTMSGVLKNAIDKDKKDYVIYQIKLKQYISDLSKYTDSLEK